MHNSRGHLCFSWGILWAGGRAGRNKSKNTHTMPLGGEDNNRDNSLYYGHIGSRFKKM